MKIAFFSPIPFSKKLGATKNRIELAEGLKKLGWQTFLIGYDELGLDNQKRDTYEYSEALKNYLIKHAHEYNVVLYEYNTLPFDRQLFSRKTLFIARPALLHYNYSKLNIPLNCKARLSSYYNQLKKLLGLKKGMSEREKDARRNLSLKECDIIQVQNKLDVELLVENGFNRDKIIVIPNGISSERINLFDSVKRTFGPPFIIAFVGTFDFRKGAMDFPYIINTLIKEFPTCKFKLLGTKGLFRTEGDVRSFFSKSTRSKITVIPVFEPKDLPALLSDCQIGIFPTYLESFGFGALEMMAAGLPVVSYEASGPSDFILSELLVPIGNKKLLTQKVADLLKDNKKLNEFALTSKEIAKKYDWSKISRTVAEIYTERFEKLCNS